MITKSSSSEALRFLLNSQTWARRVFFAPVRKSGVACPRAMQTLPYGYRPSLPGGYDWGTFHPFSNAGLGLRFHLALYGTTAKRPRSPPLLVGIPQVVKPHPVAFLVFQSVLQLQQMACHEILEARPFIRHRRPVPEIELEAFFSARTALWVKGLIR